MGSSDTTYADKSPIDRAYCPPHAKDEGFPVGVRNYEGCSVHVDNAISNERSAISGGLLRSVITFYRNGTAPTIHEVQCIGTVGKPDFCGMSQNFSMQIYSQTGATLYDSNITVSFWVSPSQSIGGSAVPFEVDSVTVTWLAGASYEQSVNVTLKDNVSNQTLASQNVTIPEIVPDVSVANLAPYATVVNEGRNARIDVDVQNQGKTTETFNVTLYANDTLIALQTVTASAANFTTISFIWNTAGFAKGNYTIKAVADTVLGETDITDNNSTDSWITVTILGDVDGDLENGRYDVDLFDAVKLLACYGAKQGDPNFDPNCDIDDNGQVFLFDAVILLSHYGQKYP
jgi:hypothetical protein